MDDMDSGGADDVTVETVDESEMNGAGKLRHDEECDFEDA